MYIHRQILGKTDLQTNKKLKAHLAEKRGAQSITHAPPISPAHPQHSLTSPTATRRSNSVLFSLIKIKQIIKCLL